MVFAEASVPCRFIPGCTPVGGGFEPELAPLHGDVAPSSLAANAAPCSSNNI